MQILTFKEAHVTVQYTCPKRLRPRVSPAGIQLSEEYGVPKSCVRDPSGISELSQELRESGRTNRVVLGPAKMVLQPLNRQEALLIGLIIGLVELEMTDGRLFAYADQMELEPGDRWRGPLQSGLPCTMWHDGSLSYKSLQVWPPDPDLSEAYRAHMKHGSNKVWVDLYGNVLMAGEYGLGVFLGRTTSDLGHWFPLLGLNVDESNSE